MLKYKADQSQNHQNHAKINFGPEYTLQLYVLTEQIT